MLTDPGQEMHQQGRLCCDFRSINTQFSQKNLKVILKSIFYCYQMKNIFSYKMNTFIHVFIRNAWFLIIFIEEDYFIIGITVTSLLTWCRKELDSCRIYIHINWIGLFILYNPIWKWFMKKIVNCSNPVYISIFFSDSIHSF